MRKKRRSATDVFVKGDIGTTPQPIYIIFLYFKALYFNSDYRDYWAYKNADNSDQVEKLEAKYKGAQDIASLFGDVFDTTLATDNRDILGTFADWFKANGSRVRPIFIDKFKVIRANKPIKPKAGTVYFTAPEKSDPAFITSHFDDDFLKSINRMRKVFKKYWLPLGKTDYYKTDKLQATAKRLDVYVWRRVCKLKDKEAIFKAYESGDSHWDKLKSDLDELVKGRDMQYTELSSDDLQNQRSEFNTLLSQAKKVVANSITGKFPSTS
jgi:hypothetical protein